MELTAELKAPCSAVHLFSWVDDLDRYDEWLRILHRTQPAAPVGDNPAWNVDLRAQLGPFSRAKRLRMERTHHEAGADRSLAVFERRELDDRTHGIWVLRAEVTPADEGSHLAMQLHYDGRLWGAALGTVLNQEIERSRQRLLALVSAAP